MERNSATLDKMFGCLVLDPNLKPLLPRNPKLTRTLPKGISKSCSAPNFGTSGNLPAIQSGQLYECIRLGDWNRRAH